MLNLLRMNQLYTKKDISNFLANPQGKHFSDKYRITKSYLAQNCDIKNENCLLIHMKMLTLGVVLSSDDKMQKTLNDQYLISCLILNEIKATKNVSPFILEELVVQCSYLIHVSSKVEVKDMTKDYLEATSELLK